MGAITSVCCDPNDKGKESIYNQSHSQMTNSPHKHDNNNNYESVKLHKNNDEEITKMLEAKAKIKKKIQFDDFQIDGKLGEGGFGIVYLAQLKENLQNGVIEKYAMKKVSKELLIKKRVYENTKLQKTILATFECKFIVALIMAFQDPWFVYFVMECASGGDTYSLIKKNSPKLSEFRSLGESAVRFIAGCVILGLEYLHKHNIMYRDLKPENVLMFDNGYMKLTDFGLAKKSVDDMISKTVSGTPFYYAPEMILKIGYKKQVDLWTLGVYLYELSVFEPPFTTDQITKTKFQKNCQDAQNNRNWKGANLSQELKDLINQLLKFNPSARLGANGWDSIKNHAFFEDFDWDALENQKMQSPMKKLICKFPVTLKPYKQQAVKQIQMASQQAEKVEGWTYMKIDN